MNRAKIIATVGPASSSQKVLNTLYKSGVDIFRINMSHGNYQEHGEVIKRIRKINSKTGYAPAILLDLQGPKIRVGKLGKDMILKERTDVIISSSGLKSLPDVIPVTYKKFSSDVSVGNTILLDDGRMELKVKSKTKKGVVCNVIRGGVLKEHKGINLPDVKVSIHSLTKKDIGDVKFAVKNSVDFIALSFVQEPQDIKDLKSVLKKSKSEIPVIAKIEKPQALNHLEKILELSEGVMVARGDLGVEVSPQKVPVIQKEIIHKANKAGKIVIIATQMLESMITEPIPTRAEANDVANAVFDGTDAVMLSGETAVGAYPVKCVEVMRKIIVEAEKSSFSFYANGDLDINPGFLPHIVAEAAYRVSTEMDSSIVVFTLSGSTAFYLSKLRPKSDIIALSPSSDVCRKLRLAWGVKSVITPFSNNFDRMIALGERNLIKSKFVKKGQTIIILAGATTAVGGTNMVKIHEIGY